jgi:hypothetical protein
MALHTFVRLLSLAGSEVLYKSECPCISTPSGYEYWSCSYKQPISSTRLSSSVMGMRHGTHNISAGTSLFRDCVRAQDRNQTRALGGVGIKVYLGGGARRCPLRRNGTSTDVALTDVRIDIAVIHGGSATVKACNIWNVDTLAPKYRCILERSNFALLRIFIVEAMMCPAIVLLG